MESYPTAYYYAMEVAEEISGMDEAFIKYGVNMKSVFGHAFCILFGEKSKVEKVEMRDYLYGSGIGSAKLLESRLHNKYPHLEVIGTGL